MSIDRRHFLINTGVAAASGLTAAGQRSALKSVPQSAVDDLQSRASVREQFDALSLSRTESLEFRLEKI